MKEKSPAAEWRRHRNGLGELERLMKLRGRVNPDFLAALRADFKAHGHEAVELARRTRPLGYLKFAAVFLDEVDPDEAAARRAARDAAVEATRAASRGKDAASPCPLPDPPPHKAEGDPR
jgi:hypothetical protein